MNSKDDEFNDRYNSLQYHHFVAVCYSSMKDKPVHGWRRPSHLACAYGMLVKHSNNKERAQRAYERLFSKY